MKWRLFPILFAISITSTNHAVAQEAVAVQRNDLSGALGRTFVSDQGIVGSTSSDNLLRFGSGLTFEINYARLLTAGNVFGLRAEIPFVVNPDQDLHAAPPNRIPEQYRSFMAAPSAKVNFFPDAAVSPWVSFGAGFAHFSESSTLLFGGKNTGPTGTTTSVVQGGFGLDVKLVKSFTLRGEVRDFWTGVPKLGVNTGKTRQHNYFLGSGVMWRF